MVVRRAAYLVIATLFFSGPSPARACFKWEAGLIYALPSNHQANGQGARAKWSTRLLLSPNNDPFTLVSLIAATGEQLPPNPDPQGFVPTGMFNPGGMVESGHERTRFNLPGGGTMEGQFYFSFHIKWVGGVMTAEEKWFPDSNGNPLPVVLNFTAQNFGAGSCEGTAVAPICSGQPTTTAWACIQNFNRCVSWPNHGAAGTRFFTLGIEASCGSSTASFVDKHYINTVQYRYNSSWVNMTSPLPFKGITVNTPTGPTTHGGNADFDLRMCTPTTANKVIGWLHDNQTNPSCN
jgi:hypothetical protein